MAGITLRRVASRAELRSAVESVMAMFPPPVPTMDEDRFAELDRAFDTDRPMMLVIESRGRLVGGVFGFRSDAGSTLRLLAVHEAFRRRGLGRRLVQTFEVAAMELGVRSIALGPNPDAKAFYERLGFHGRGRCTSSCRFPDAFSTCDCAGCARRSATSMQASNSRSMSPRSVTR